ncbi:MAG: hypothetical protein AAFO83_15150 [Cyanobacteria bacterium J06607_13]
MVTPELNKNQLKTYRKLWKEPKAKDISFSEIEKLMRALGAKKSQSKANILFEIGDERWGMHRPHPDKGLKTPYIKQIRKFLRDCRLEPIGNDENGND